MTSHHSNQTARIFEHPVCSGSSWNGNFILWVKSSKIVEKKQIELFHQVAGQINQLLMNITTRDSIWLGAQASSIRYTLMRTERGSEYRFWYPVFIHHFSKTLDLLVLKMQRCIITAETLVVREGPLEKCWEWHELLFWRGNVQTDAILILTLLTFCLPGTSFKQIFIMFHTVFLFYCQNYSLSNIHIIKMALHCICYDVRGNINIFIHYPCFNPLNADKLRINAPLRFRNLESDTCFIE